MIYNQTRRSYLAKEHKVYKNFISIGKGLMFTRKREGHALVLELQRKMILSITMAFVFYSIDIVFLDEKKSVVEIKKNLKPFMNYNPKQEFKSAVEIPTGAVKVSATKVGDVLRFM